MVAVHFTASSQLTISQHWASYTFHSIEPVTLSNINWCWKFFVQNFWILNMHFCELKFGQQFNNRPYWLFCLIFFAVYDWACAKYKSHESCHVRYFSRCPPPLLNYGIIWRAFISRYVNHTRSVRVFSNWALLKRVRKLFTVVISLIKQQIESRHFSNSVFHQASS